MAKITQFVGASGISQDNKTVDLPASTSNPAEIDCSGDTILGVVVFVFGEAFLTVAKTQADANTRAGSDATRVKVPQGNYEIPLIGAEGQKLYFKSTSTLVSSGLSYFFLKAL